jgi:hypothetical protein
VLSLTDADIMTWVIVIGEARGGVYDIKRRAWSKPPPPETVYAQLVEMTGPNAPKSSDSGGRKSGPSRRR